jgi:hypothetical protein
MFFFVDWKSKIATTARHSFNIGQYGEMKNKFFSDPITGILIEPKL